MSSIMDKPLQAKVSPESIKFYNSIEFVMAKTIALTPATHFLLQRYKKEGDLSSMDEVVSQLFRSGERSVERILAARRKEVTTTCRQLGIVRLTAFGSRVWGAPHPRSDVDLVADFGSRKISAFGLLEAEEELAMSFGLPVDLHTWAGLRPRVRQRVEEKGVDLIG